MNPANFLQKEMPIFFQWYVIQVKEFLIKCSTSWPYLISEFLVAYITIVASDWPRTFFTPKVFLFSISLLFVRDSKKIL